MCSSDLENLVNLQAWLDKHGDLFSFIPPQAGGMAFMRYALNINSTDLSHWLREQESVFIIPGDCYGMDGYIRIRSEEHTSELQSRRNLVCRLLLEKKNPSSSTHTTHPRFSTTLPTPA